MEVAVLISTYNGERFLSKQIDSILNQDTKDHISIFIRDDGSKDRTKEIINKYSMEWNVNEVVGLNNLGPAKSFMTLLMECGEYDYYAFSDQDDIWDEDKIKQGVDELRNICAPAIYHSNARLVDSDLNDLGRNTYRNPPTADLYTVFCACNVQGCTMIINKQLAKLVKEAGMPEHMTMHDAYLARVCTSIGGTIIYDHRPHMSYRQHDANVIGIKTSRYAKLKNRIIEITSPAKSSVSDQANEILDKFQNLISENNKNWLQKVSGYKKGILSRIGLAFSPKPHYITHNEGITYRLKILLGNK